MTAGGDGFPFSGNCEICEISDERYFDMLQRYVRELPDQKIQDKYRNPDGLGRITVINSKTDSKTDSLYLLPAGISPRAGISPPAEIRPPAPSRSSRTQCRKLVMQHRQLPQ